MLGPIGSPAGDLVFPSINSTGHSSHSDHVQHILDLLAQVGAPDGDAGASVYRSSQWLHLFQDKDIVSLCALRQSQLPPSRGSSKGGDMPAFQHTE